MRSSKNPIPRTAMERLHSRSLRCVVAVALCLMTVLASGGASLAQPQGWSQPVNLSRTAEGDPLSPDLAWFPDLAVDTLGRVHVVWCQTTHMLPGEEARTLADNQYRTTTEGERLFYTVWDGESWAAPTDIGGPRVEIYRNALAVDSSDQLHLAFEHKLGGLGGIGIFLSQAPADSAGKANAWSSKRPVSARGRSYATDLAFDGEGVLHLVFDDEGDVDSPECPACADVYYRRSTDRGETWSPPVNLSRTPMGASREQLETGANGVVHVTWDEGWDRISGRGLPDYSMYVSSRDGGLTWRSPIQITDPSGATAQLAVGADDGEGVMLVWRIASMRESQIYYQWSVDQGDAWGRPQVLPGVYARPWGGNFDMYDMATDSAGHIHLVVVGRRSPGSEERLGVYHLEWDGVSWSAPELLYQGENHPEYPKIAINQGNQLHVAWFTRSETDGQGGGGYDVWYSRGESQAPLLAPVREVRPSAVPTTEVPAIATTPFPETPTPSPAFVLDKSGVPVGVHTEREELRALAIGLVPVLVTVACVWLARWRRRGR